MWISLVISVFGQLSKSAGVQVACVMLLLCWNTVNLGVSQPDMHMLGTAVQVLRGRGSDVIMIT